MKSFLSAILFTFAVSPALAEQCYELSKDGKTWEANPFTLCIEENSGGTSDFKLTLSKEKRVFAVYFLNSLPGAALSFGIDAMSGSVMDDSVGITVGFGEVRIGSSTYFYKE